MKKILLLMSCLFWAGEIYAQEPIGANDPNIEYWGRIDFSDELAPAFEYSGVTIKARFTGTSVTAIIEDLAAHEVTSTNYFYKIIDNGEPEKFEALEGVNIYPLAEGLDDGYHTIELIKLTEASVGRSVFRGFILQSGEKLLPMNTQPTCEIEFIGNSITCGYGNEISLTEPNTGFHSINQNNYKAWGYVAARNLGYRYKAIAVSGRGLYRNNTGSTTETIPLIYDRIFPFDPLSPSWDHASDHPEIIVINLGTNDFFIDPGTPVDEELFSSTYIQFINKLFSYHPDSKIICATGVMMTDYYPAGAMQWSRITSLVEKVVDTLKAKGFQNVFYFQMETQSAPYGEDWHPTMETHERMAAELTGFINNNLSACENVTSIFEATEAPGLLYPNPAHERLKLNFKEVTEWRLLTANGVSLRKGNSSEIEIEGFDPGVYILVISTESRTIYQKILIQ